MGRYVLGALLVLVACSSNVPATQDAPIVQPDAPPGPDPNDGARSGSRLKLTWYELADGTRQWNGFYDAQRKENCYIYDGWVDGNAYCTPDYDGSIEYTDAGCTQKVIEVYKDPNCPTTMPQPYALEWNYTPCESHPAHLWSRGAKTTLASYYYKSSDGSCYGPYTTSTSYDYYALGAEIPTSALVEISLGPPTGTGRLGERFWQSADGMRRQGVVHDSALGSTCYPGDHGCEPSARYVAYEENSTCTTPKLAIAKQCDLPKFAVYYANNACYSDPPHYYTLGAATTGSPLYNFNGSTCTAATPSTTDNFYKMGTEVTLTSVDRVVGTDGQRIQLIHYTTADGLDHRSYSLYDSQKGAECYPTTLPDGTIRCVVFGGYVDTFYKDTGCTQPIDLVEVSGGGGACTVPAPPRYARKYVAPAPGSCSYGTRVYAVGSQYAATVYEMSGTCVAHAPAGTKRYSLGAEVPLTDFVTAQVSIDP